MTPMQMQASPSQLAAAVAAAVSAEPAAVQALTSKAATLSTLSGRLASALLLPQFAIPVRQWRHQRQQVLDAIAALPWTRAPLAVRSSTMIEDLSGGLHAGAYLSLLGVEGHTALIDAIEQVIASYGAGHANDEVLLQPMLRGTTLSGVAFTRDLRTNAPYRTINYAQGDDTTAVTGGAGGSVSNFVHHRHAPLPDGRLGRVLRLCLELEAIFAVDSLDIEFAFDADDALVLLQVRRLAPLACERGASPRGLHWAYQRAAGLLAHDPRVLGRGNVLSVMTDWNPAEMIGTSPHPLSLGLYRYLVSDGIWAQQRFDYGYRDLRGRALIHTIGNKPFVDVRLSLNSLVPRALPGALAQTIVEEGLERLRAQPDLHDKVEFEIAQSAWYFDLDERMRARYGNARMGDAAALLKAHTCQVLLTPAHHQREWARLRAMQRAHAQLQTQSPGLGTLRALLRITRDYGTLPFAGLARLDFIAHGLLHSLQRLDVLSRASIDALYASVVTAGAQLAQDLHSRPLPELLARYGHLRPGTYDIRSPRYDEKPEHYFPAGGHGEAPPPTPEFALPAPEAQRLQRLLRAHAIDLPAHDFLQRLATAMHSRDRAKFLFTRPLSDALQLLAVLGERHGLDREALSYCDLPILLAQTSGSDASIIQRAMEFGRQRYRNGLGILSPPVLLDADDLLSFGVQQAVPTFVTRKRVSGPIRTDLRNGSVDEGIVFIENADPGYDWIFSHPIRGFVTAYGGANSHMALRAHALDIPAAIGVGEDTFNRLSAKALAELDCAAEIVRAH